ncbi:MAG TPA: hypothetical protein VF773_12970 [Verrucomicrobiae bacterium]
MVTPTCPKCRAVLPSADINVTADVAFCRNCNLAHTLSGLAQGTGISTEVNLHQPPAGTWKQATALGTLIGASHRSVGGAFGVFLFAAFWNGIVSVFVVIALSSTLSLLGVSTPEWFPAPKMKGGGAMGVGMTVFLWLFLTPFIAIGLALIGAFLSCLGGKTEIRVRDYDGEIFSGIGALGFKKKFKREAVKDVRIEDRQWRDSDGDRRRNTHIVIDLLEGKPLKFGSSLPEERRQFLAASLRHALIK